MHLFFNSVVAVGTLGIFNPLGTCAFPAWAGTCGAGADISGKGVHSTSTNSVEDKDVSVKIANTTLAAGGTPFSVIAGETVTLEIDGNAPSTVFRGFLLRLSDRSGTGMDVTDYLVVPPQNDDDPRKILKLESDGEGEAGNFGTPPKCAEGVAGVCHTKTGSGRAPERFSESIQLKPFSAGELKLEVTVVIQAGQDNWGYSTYDLDVIGSPTSAPSSAPSSSPTSPPTQSMAPTSPPTQSMAPSGSPPPTSAPSSPPTSTPTSSPTSAPTAAPSSSPTSPPTESMAPSESPSDSPEEPPTSGGSTIANKIFTILAASATAMTWLVV